MSSSSSDEWRREQHFGVQISTLFLFFYTWPVPTAAASPISLEMTLQILRSFCDFQLSKQTNPWRHICELMSVTLVQMLACVIAQTRSFTKLYRGKHSLCQNTSANIESALLPLNSYKMIFIQCEMHHNPWFLCCWWQWCYHSFTAVFRQNL